MKQNSVVFGPKSKKNSHIFNNINCCFFNTLIYCDRKLTLPMQEDMKEHFQSFNTKGIFEIEFKLYYHELKLTHFYAFSWP